MSCSYDVYLEHKQSRKLQIITVQAKLVSQDRSDNEQSSHWRTSTDTSSRTKSPNGQGIDQNSTWFQIDWDRLSSIEGDGSGCWNTYTGIT